MNATLSNASNVSQQEYLVILWLVKGVWECNFSLPFFRVLAVHILVHKMLSWYLMVHCTAIKQIFKFHNKQKDFFNNVHMFLRRTKWHSGISVTVWNISFHSIHSLGQKQWLQSTLLGGWKPEYHQQHKKIIVENNYYWDKLFRLLLFRSSWSYNATNGLIWWLKQLQRWVYFQVTHQQLLTNIQLA